LAVPRSTAMSRPPMPVRYEKKPIGCAENRRYAEGAGENATPLGGSGSV
jgi:hypothetical protein